MVIVKLTNGFGNNLFQYIAGRILAEFHNQKIFCITSEKNYYASQDLKNLNVPIYNPSIRENIITKFSSIRISDDNFSDYFEEKYQKKHFILKGYFEDNNIFKKHIPKIKTWFPLQKKKNNNDLVLHFRGGDRLFYKNEFPYKPSPDSFISAINRFEFEKLYIVTDMPSWNYLTADELERNIFHNKVKKEMAVPIQSSVNYFNSVVAALEKFDPILYKKNLSDEFNFIRSFDKILFQNSTTAWWAARLSNASKVGVLKGWRNWKKNNKTNLLENKNWFQW